MNAVDIVSNLEQFTEDEKARINALATNSVENITFDDMQLYARWQASNALADKRFQDEQAAQEAVTQARIEDSRNVANASIEALNAQADLARARLKAVENGQV